MDDYIMRCWDSAVKDYDLARTDDDRQRALKDLYRLSLLVSELGLDLDLRTPETLRREHGS